MEYMKTIPDKYFELAIVDPPYGIGISSNMGRRKGQKNSGMKKAYWDNEPPSAEYFNELFRVSKNQIIWGGNYFFLPPTRCFVIWKKIRVSEEFSMSMCEYAWCSFNEVAKVTEIDNYEEKRFHPTQKPVKLYEWLLTHYAKQGDKILDTHLGSGSSRMACYNLGFDFVGCEIDEDYFKAQEERYQAHISQQSLFV